MFLLFAVLKRLHLITSHFFGFMKLPLVSPSCDCLFIFTVGKSESLEIRGVCGMRVGVVCVCGAEGLFKVHSIDGEPRWNMLTGCTALIVKVMIARIIGGILSVLKALTKDVGRCSLTICCKSKCELTSSEGMFLRVEKNHRFGAVPVFGLYFVDRFTIYSNHTHRMHTQQPWQHCGYYYCLLLAAYLRLLLCAYFTSLKKSLKLQINYHSTILQPLLLLYNYHYYYYTTSTISPLQLPPMPLIHT